MLNLLIYPLPTNLAKMGFIIFLFKFKFRGLLISPNPCYIRVSKIERNDVAALPLLHHVSKVGRIQCEYITPAVSWTLERVIVWLHNPR